MRISRPIRLVAGSLCLTFTFPLGAAPRTIPHYQVDAALDPVRAELKADVTIELPPQPAGAQITFLLGRSYGEPLVEAKGANVDVVDDGSAFRRITLNYRALAHAPRARLRYGGRLNPSGEPPINNLSPALVELNLDSMWLPIDARFATRFTSDTRLHGLPSTAVVVGQGVISRRGQVVRLVRSQGDIDVAFAAAPGLRRVRSGPLDFFARDPETERARQYRSHGTAAVTFLERLLGSMPSKPVRVVMIERPRVSGYARRGYVVVTDGSAASEAGIAKFVAHEFAHAWFSNALPSGEDRWLDESTAEYIGIRYVQASIGKAAAEDMVERKRAATVKTGPMLGAARGDSELYSKGPVLLVDLEQRIGRAKMDQLLRAVALRKVGKTGEFLGLVREFAGNETAIEFETMLRR